MLDCPEFGTKLPIEEFLIVSRDGWTGTFVGISGNDAAVPDR